MTNRPDVDELKRVESGAILLRLVRSDAYDAAQPPGTRVQPRALQQKDFKPSPTSYGASVFVAAQLRDGVETLAEEDDRWNGAIYACVPVDELRKMGFDARYSPQDCPNPRLAPAHASLIGVNKDNRVDVLRLLDDYLENRPPDT